MIVVGAAILIALQLGLGPQDATPATQPADSAKPRSNRKDLRIVADDPQIGLSRVRSAGVAVILNDAAAQHLNANMLDAGLRTELGKIGLRVIPAEQFVSDAASKLVNLSIEVIDGTPALYLIKLDLLAVVVPADSADVAFPVAVWSKFHYGYMQREELKDGLLSSTRALLQQFGNEWSTKKKQAP